MVAVLNVFAIVGTVAALFLGPMGQIATTIAVSSFSAAALATSAAHDPPVDTDLAADTVDGVLNNMVFALGEIQRGVYNGERKVIELLRVNLDLTTDTSHLHGVASTRDAFLPPRPALVGESMIPDLVLSEFQPS